MFNKMINQKLENKSFESSNDEQMHLGLGVIFIKSRKSDDKIWGEIDEMKALAESGTLLDYVMTMDARRDEDVFSWLEDIGFCIVDNQERLI